MRSIITSATLTLIALSLVGCGGDTNSNSPLQGNLDAALAINESYKRDDALAKVAEEAGNAGDVDIARKAIKKIRENHKQDTAAATAALKFAKQGKTAEATEVAKLINEIYKRDQTLSEIAKTPQKSEPNR